MNLQREPKEGEVLDKNGRIEEISRLASEHAKGNIPIEQVNNAIILHTMQTEDEASTDGRREILEVLSPLLDECERADRKGYDVFAYRGVEEELHSALKKIAEYKKEQK